jgi:leucine dehydrogenase
MIESWDGFGVVSRYDRPTGTWIFIALHDVRLGPATGGCRLKSYESIEAGLLDAMRLAEGMTYKWAAAGLPHGGGKVVLAASRELVGEERAGLFRRTGELIEGLRGTFGTGMDLGTTPDDMAAMAETTRFVHGVLRDGSEVVDPGPFTAAGVLAAIRVVVRRALGADSLAGATVLVEGVGDVGGPLARLLAEAGATVRVSDLNERKAAALGAELNAEVVQPHVVHSMHCDVYSPCAVGATLKKNTIPHLNCRTVAGSANNQLEELADADLLHQRGILYAPDYITNSGGAVAFHALGEGADRDEAMARVAGIESILEDVLGEAAMRDESPVHAAQRRAQEILASASGNS